MPVSSIDPFGLESSDNPPPGSFGLEQHLLGALLAKAAIERLAAIIADAERIGMGGETRS